MAHKDPEKKREYDRRWRENNAERKRETDRAWVIANRDRHRENGRRWREENREKCNERERQQYADDAVEREKSLERTRRWAKANPDKVRAKCERRRARREGATIGDPVEIESREIEIRESKWCEHCKAKVDDIQIDHIHPLSKGGAHSVENLQGLCAKHNREKGDKV